MVRDGYFYGLGLVVAALLLTYVTGNVWAAIPALLLAAFFLWFFRDPRRTVPDDPGLVVSPADGKVTAIDHIQGLRGRQIRMSIFLSVFNVHVNRSPIAGVIAGIDYRKGKYLNALNPASADENEQNRVVVDDGHCQVAFRQIAGLLARRIVFHKKVGDRVERGERVGLIKFGSRVDVMIPGDAEVLVKLGETVHGGSSVLAVLASREEPELIGRSAEKTI